MLLMEVNDHLLHNKFYNTLKEQTTDMEEFTHKCWGPKEPYTHYLGKSPIDGGYKSPEVEIVNLSMLNFAEYPSNHRSLLFDISTCSLLGKFRYKVCRPVSNSQPPLGPPTSVRAISSTKVTQLQDGLSHVNTLQKHNNCWELTHIWGGGWMWEDIDFTQETIQDLK